MSTLPLSTTPLSTTPPSPTGRNRPVPHSRTAPVYAHRVPERASSPPLPVAPTSDTPNVFHSTDDEDRFQAADQARQAGSSDAAPFGAKLKVLVRLSTPMDSEAYSARIGQFEGFVGASSAAGGVETLFGQHDPEEIMTTVMLTDRCRSASHELTGGAVPAVVLVDPRLGPGGACSCCRRMSKNCGWATLLDALCQEVGRKRPSANSPRITNPVSPGGAGEDPADKATRQRLENLTRRELDVLKLVAQGLSVRQCAEELGVTVSTVGNHKYRLMKKLGVKTSLEALRLAVRYGLADL